MSEKITPRHLERKALIYVRQSSPQQVTHNLESKRLQYAMRARISELGWRQIEVIDEDLGRTANGTVERTGFDRMVAEVCLGQVGAVAAGEVSRFARNSRDWHQLIEMCSLVDTLVIDQDAIYDIRNSNDRLLLGLKGSLSEYELDLLRHRAEQGRRAKAARGEFYSGLPAGYVKTEDGRLLKDPDRRVQHAIELVFDKFLELGSAHQVLAYLLEHGVELPVRLRGCARPGAVWKSPSASIVTRILSNPIYAGVYVYGRRKLVSSVRDGRVRRRAQVRPAGGCDVLIRDHHESYIACDTFERIQQMKAKNAPGFGKASGGAPKEGSALLSGLLRCARCGRKLRVTYTGSPRVQRYVCDQGRAQRQALSCLAFGGQLVDAAVAAEVLRVVQPAALEAAATAARQTAEQNKQLLETLQLELEAVRYSADLARRQYDAVDPGNRLVAGELETRWNAALAKMAQVQQRLDEELAKVGPARDLDAQALQSLATDLPRVWNEPEAEIRLKKRIVRTLIEEIVVDVDVSAPEIRLVVHWKGGVHTELSVRRRRRGEHGRATSPDTIDAVRAMALVCSDESIAHFLSRNGLRTAHDHPWSKQRVTSLRKDHAIPVHSKARQAADGWMTLNQAAAHVGTTAVTLRRAIERGQLKALHPLGFGPWIIQRVALDRPEVRGLFAHIRARRDAPTIRDPESRNLRLPGT
jgi:DNA invertase Pin-like site-specific DNA recombinase